MPYYLGVDSSNYTSSVAVYNSATGEIVQNKQLLPVKQGQLGVRQSDAVFLHVKQLGELLEPVLRELPQPPAAVGASAYPRDEEGSYMPCFLVGLLAGQAVASALQVPLHRFSHQAGHVMAALYSADKLDLLEKPFLAFHLSGGTTECLLVQSDRERILNIQLMAGTLDLNAGQVVDRVGLMLGLPFPAGPALERLAGQSAQAYRPKVALKGMDCCLSGLENQCRDKLEGGEAPADVAAYCLDYLAEALLAMTRKALEHDAGLPLVYAGGVMSNKRIRARVLEQHAASFAEPAFSCDNAAGTAILCAAQEEGLLCRS